MKYTRLLKGSCDPDASTLKQWKTLSGNLPQFQVHDIISATIKRFLPTDPSSTAGKNESALAHRCGKYLQYLQWEVWLLLFIFML